MPKKALKVFLTYTDEEFKNYYSHAGLVELQRHAQVIRNTTGRVLEGRELAEAAASCQVIVAHRSAAGLASTFEHAPELIAFLRGAVDISTIDVSAASMHGVLVAQASAGFGRAVAEMGLGMMIDLARGISRARAAYEQREEPLLAKGLQLNACTLGIVGYGRIGRHLAEMAAAIGMRVRVCDPHFPQDQLGVMAATFDELLHVSDFVVCLAVATPETANLMNAHAFSIMRPGASFINLSRGELVDEDALEATLDAGHLRGAGLDVGRAKDQKPSSRFVGRPDVVLMPHVGGMTVQAREHQTMDTVRQVAALAAGRMPEGAVNAAAAYRLNQFLKQASTQ
jgi:D-3-phosphoglycerate dehydrogenase